jgi:YegS/Rv2252/BmrU family lipid kinase
MLTSGGMHRHARIVANPAAAGGRDQAAALRAAIGVLERGGWAVSLEVTTRAGHAEDLARQAAAEGVALVVVAGGDGSVNEVTNGLIGGSSALAVLPAGTGNVLAAQLGLVGIPTALHRPDLATAAAALCRGTFRWVDTGYAWHPGGPGRHFLMWAGIGLDAAITHALEGESRELKRLLGPAAFGAVGLRAALRSSGMPTAVRVDARRLRLPLLMAVVANIPLYAGTVLLTRHARMDDGWLETSLFAGEDVRSAAVHLGAVLAGRSEDAPLRTTLRGRRFRFLTGRPLPVHLDAEPFGTTPLAGEVRPHSLRLLVPPTAPRPLFDPAPEGDP